MSIESAGETLDFLFSNISRSQLSNSSLGDNQQCKPGLLLPVWETNNSLTAIIIHGIIYFLALCYSFVGVAIIADRFMGAIEMITSQEKDVVVTSKKTGEKQIISVRIWNETVSNLTLMALGSSAPEILLSVIEIYANHYEAGDLGPGTIVGSAAFNMFVIIAICVYCIPSPEVKKIKHLRVFIVTLIFSIFAYLWMLFILVGSSPGIITVTEGLTTFMLFPLTVLLAYIADRRLLVYKYLDKRYRMDKRGIIVASEGNAADEIELGTDKASDGVDGKYLRFMSVDVNEEELKEYEQDRQAAIEIIKNLKNKYPDAKSEQIEELARNEILNLRPKSHAFYRVQLSNKFLGTSNIKTHYRVAFKDEDDKQKTEKVSVKLLFNPAEYTVREDVGQFNLIVTRLGEMNSSLDVDYETEDGTAKRDSDYVYSQGTLRFGPGEAHKQITIRVVNDDVFEEDEYFFVALKNARFLLDSPDESKRPEIEILEPAKAKVIILDDDHSGVFCFHDASVQIEDSIGEFNLKVQRYCGARGKVALTYKTIPITAKDGQDFISTEGKIVFEDNEPVKTIPIKIIDTDDYEKNVTFQVEIRDPKREDFNGSKKDGGPKIGDVNTCLVRIRESKEFRVTVDKLIRKARAVSVMSTTSSWEGQFSNIMTVPSFEEPEEAEVDQQVLVEKKKTWYEYIIHYLVLFWKVIFACVPPTQYFNGWACFIVSIIIIGILTALIGDLAAHFGCTIHLKDSITAISIVALGTSLPDTFASKIAAQNDKFADSSIGNVTGSNAVNVFLGIGIAWSIAAIYHAYNGTVFYVKAGNLGFSVTLFCITAFVCTLVLVLRRSSKLVGGELGGPWGLKVGTSALFVGLWIIYLVFSTLEAYGVVHGF